MARLIFDGLTKKQATVFADWFEGQGEQDCTTWFEEEGIPAPSVDVSQKYVELDDDLIVQCK